MSGTPRRLLSFRRPVAPADAEAYDRLWSALQAEAVAAGAHAWRFGAVKDAGIRLEFLEFAEDADPRTRPAVTDLLSRLESEIGGALEEEWVER